MTVYISIGNSDYKLTQAEWSRFVADLLGWVEWLHEERGGVHGVWYSAPDSQFQNMCVCLEVPSELSGTLRSGLAKLAVKYRQDSIAWAEAPKTEFIGGTS